MDKLIIRGGRRLSGTIDISGAKNSALKLMCASLLADGSLTLSNMPRLMDINTLTDLLNHMGVTVTVKGGNGGRIKSRTITFDASSIMDTRAPYDFVRKMRASILVLGPLLARTGTATVSLPGGCAIGTRPIDLHIQALTAMGATIELENGYVHATARGGLKGATIRFPFVSVGATENSMMAATLASGTTILENAAREPEIADLAGCLNAMGARVSGAGSSIITIEGVSKLTSASYRVMPDRIEAGSYAVAAAITGGDILLNGTLESDLSAVAEKLRDAGAEVSTEFDGLRVTQNGPVRATNITTEPFPGFPTDLQAQFMALMSVADGTSTITETIFENRFMHVSELARMGADITVTGSHACVRGHQGLKGAPVMATDLRASIGLVLAGLAASGETHVNRLYHLDRGYEQLEEKLRGVGADIERVPA